MDWEKSDRLKALPPTFPRACLSGLKARSGIAQSWACVAAAMTLTIGVLAMPLAAADGDGIPAKEGAMKSPPSADYHFGNPKDKKGFAVWAVSARAGLTFTDSEPVDVRVRVQEAAEAATVEYALQETEGAWQHKGSLAFDKGTAEKPLPLTLPGRGLFKLTLSAKSGNASSEAQTWIAVVFTPLKASYDSPWGMLALPQDYDAKDPNGPRDAAMNKRMLGASWVRFNYCYPAFEPAKIVVESGENPKIAVDLSDQLKYAQALHDQGIFLMGHYEYMPQVFSSKPDDKSVQGDSAPGYAGVPPRDYKLWGQFMEIVAAKYRGLIQVWQIGNEPDLAGRYWRGTPQQLVELVEHTAAAIRKGDPAARIASAGFTTGATGYADMLLELGMGKHIDILTVHYTDQDPGAIGAWRGLLKKHNLQIPIWNSEEKSAIPLNNIVGGQGPFMKFLHVDVGYPEYQNLVRKDFTALPPGIAFSVGAHCIGSAKCVGGSDKLAPGCEVFFLQRGDEKVTVLRNRPAPAKLLDPNWRRAKRVTLKLEAVADGQPVTVTDIWGRSRALEPRDGQVELSVADGYTFINGARQVEIVKAELPPAQPAGLVFEAESGKWSNGWQVSTHPGYSDNRLLELWAGSDPGPEGYWAEVKFSVPADGKYELIFAGTTLEGLIAGKSWLSAFAWAVDGGAERKVEAPLPVIKNVAGAPQGISILNTPDLKVGEHTFRLRLLKKNDPPHSTWAMWFDAIALRPAGEPKPAKP